MAKPLATDPTYTEASVTPTDVPLPTSGWNLATAEYQASYPGRHPWETEAERVHRLQCWRYDYDYMHDEDCWND